MALLTSLETVIRENADHEKDVMQDAIARWMKKKKQSTDVYRRLRSDFIRSHPGLGDPSDMELPAPATVEELQWN